MSCYSSPEKYSNISCNLLTSQHSSLSLCFSFFQTLSRVWNKRTQGWLERYHWSTRFTRCPYHLHACMRSYVSLPPRLTFLTSRILFPFLSLSPPFPLFVLLALSISLSLILAIIYISTLFPHSTFVSLLSSSSILVTQIHVLTYGQISRSYVLHIRLLARTLPGFFPVLYVHSSDDEYRETH